MFDKILTPIQVFATVPLYMCFYVHVSRGETFLQRRLQDSNALIVLIFSEAYILRYVKDFVVRQKRRGQCEV